MKPNIDGLFSIIFGLKCLLYGSTSVQSKRIALKCICSRLTGVSESGP